MKRRECPLRYITAERGAIMPKTCVEINFREEAVTRLDEIGLLIGATTRIKTIRRILKFFQWLVDMHKGGYTFYIKKEGGSLEQIQFPDSV